MNLFAGLEWWQILIGVFVGLFLLMILVLIHELGHAILALRNGVEVEEFGLGMPPRAIKLGYIKHYVRDPKTGKKTDKVASKTLVTLNWLLPLGGFCKMKGESDSDRRKGAFGAATFAAKTKILFAGVTVNLIAAMVIFTVLAWVGMPIVDSNQFRIESDNYGVTGVVSVASVVDDSAAAHANIKEGDIITEIETFNDGKSTTHEIHVDSDLSNVTKSHKGEEVNIKILRNGAEISEKVELGNDPEKGALGVLMTQEVLPTIRATWSAPIVGIVNTLQFVWLTILGLIGLIAGLFSGIFGFIIGSSSAGADIGAAASSVAGPVGIFAILSQGLFAGPTQLLFIMGIISLTLTVMNILPVPAFDGGRWYLIAWYKFRGKELTIEKEEKVVGIGVLIIIGIFLLATLSDILKFF